MAEFEQEIADAKAKEKQELIEKIKYDNDLWSILDETNLLSLSKSNDDYMTLSNIRTKLLSKISERQLKNKLELFELVKKEFEL